MGESFHYFFMLMLAIEFRTSAFVSELVCAEVSSFKEPEPRHEGYFVKGEALAVRSRIHI